MKTNTRQKLSRKKGCTSPIPPWEDNKSLEVGCGEDLSSSAETELKTAEELWMSLERTEIRYSKMQQHLQTCKRWLNIWEKNKDSFRISGRLLEYNHVKFDLLETIKFYEGRGIK